MEHRAGGALRLAGRQLRGIAMPYGSTAPEFREKFLPGAFAPIGAVPLLLQHDPRSIVIPAGELRLDDGPDELRVSGALLETSAAFSLIKRGSLQGLSVGFDAVRERREGAVRVVEKARLGEVSIVDSPAFPDARLEVRAKIGSISGRVPYAKKVSCRCKAGCTHAKFQPGSLKAAAESDDELLAIRGSYADTVASKSTGTLRLDETAEGLSFSIDLPDTSAARDIIEQSGAAKLIARPVWSEAASKFTVVDSTAEVSEAHVKALLIGPTDASEGWPALKIEGETRVSPAARRYLFL